jgi:pyrroloquinoline quinone biosynthesis protein B
MHVRLLGTAAGGGFPQWNCACQNCRAARDGAGTARRRTQSSAAVSADGRAWFLLNASPDVRAQVESFPPLLPTEGRSTAIRGVLLTGADLDHVLGLFQLREGGRLSVHATPATRAALDKGLRLSAVLGCYGGIDWHHPPSTPGPLRGADGAASGLLYAAFAVPGRPPRYQERDVGPDHGDTVGYRIIDEWTGGRLVYAPGLAAISPEVAAAVWDCDLLLLDGTFWSDDEMATIGVDTAAQAMGHLPVGGPGGSLTFVARLPVGRTIYVHVNNTNPVLRDDSPEWRAVAAAGAAVGHDGQEFIL